jgi:1,4-alpha-glucan branching enzyme
VGDFNRWNPASHLMRRRVDGWWFIEVQLTHGHHRYRFLVDDKPVLDPQGTVLPATSATSKFLS